MKNNVEFSREESKSFNGKWQDFMLKPTRFFSKYVVKYKDFSKIVDIYNTAVKFATKSGKKIISKEEYLKCFKLRRNIAPGKDFLSKYYVISSYKFILKFLPVYIMYKEQVEEDE